MKTLDGADLNGNRVKLTDNLVSALRCLYDCLSESSLRAATAMLRGLALIRLVAEVEAFRQAAAARGTLATGANDATGTRGHPCEENLRHEGTALRPAGNTRVATTTGMTGADDDPAPGREAPHLADATIKQALWSGS